MAKLPLDLSNFKKTKTEGNLITLRHKDGHTIQLAANALPHKTRKQLHDLPHFDDGGTVQPSPSPSPSPDTIGKRIGFPMSQGGMVPVKKENYSKDKYDDKVPHYAEGTGDIEPSADPGGYSAMASALAPNAGTTDLGVNTPLPPEAVANQMDTNARYGGYIGTMLPTNPVAEPKVALPGDAAPPSDPNAQAPQAGSTSQAPQAANGPAQPGAVSPDSQGGYDQALAGIQAGANAQGALGTAQAKALTTDIAAQQAVQSHFQEVGGHIDNEIQHAVNDYAQGHIDPNRLMANQSTGQKIGNAIGLLLSGFGSGVSGQPNAAMQFINNQIERDVDAQKAELGKKANLVSMYYEKFHNLKDATTMAMAVQANITAAKMQMEAAKAANPIAQANAMAAAGQLKMLHAPQLMEMKVRQALMTAAADTNNPASKALFSQKPALFIPHTGAPQADQDKMFKEVQNLENLKRITPDILDSFNKAANTMHGVDAVPGVDSADQKKFMGLLNTTITDLTGTARQAEFDSARHNFMPQVGDNANTKATKLSALNAYLRAKQSAPVSESYHLPLDKFQSTSMDPVMLLPPAQQQMVHWAKQNPQDPRSQALFKKLNINP